MKIGILLICIVFIIAAVGLAVSFFAVRNDPYEHPIYSLIPQNSPTVAPINHEGTVAAIMTLPTKKTISNSYHINQTFNNCGPASLSMLLSYYGIRESQKKLGEDLRPYQHPQGNNDDKSVTLDELGEKAKEYGLAPYHRPNGNIDILKQFIANDIPVLTRTWLKENDDIGHYRIIKGYDDEMRELIQDDSFQGKNLRYSYDAFNTLWGKFNFEYLVLVPAEKQAIIEEILGSDADEQISWANAVDELKQELENNSENIYARFNLSVALYHTGDYQGAAREFEKVENQISFRTLWYQIEPIQAYYELGNFDRVFSISDRILQNGNRAFSELYYLRGQIYEKQGNPSAARREYEQAVFYNRNFQQAKDTLQLLVD